MAETFKYPHCGALYEIISDEKIVSEDTGAADCRLCGKQMGAHGNYRSEIG
jgi:hypothetical protein